MPPIRIPKVVPCTPHHVDMVLQYLELRNQIQNKNFAVLYEDTFGRLYKIYLITK